MTKTIVILQPQFFPWLGVFEQVARCDLFIHFDHVQLAQGRSFSTRVQVKTAQGIQWLSVPTLRKKGQSIAETKVDEGTSWRKKHLSTLRTAFSSYKYKDTALNMIEEVYNEAGTNLSEINILSVERVAKYLGLENTFMRSSRMAGEGTKDDLLIDLVQKVGGDHYITGMGGLNYIDHEKFESKGISVSYPDYARMPYPQLHGEFTPYVSSLDAIAACGPDAASLIRGSIKPWREVKASQ